ncbi:MAG: ABC transporter ATP-binding protein [Chitinivibrionales bacterium]|nr:ABC transporter ATP-binding protein [Chitinivibrionales bacterium]
MNIAVKTENLSKLYGQTMAVDRLSLEVKNGEFFGFLGPNGAGKTTTIRLLTGIIRPDEGTAIIQENLPAGSIEAKLIAGVMPESRGLYEWMTAREYLSLFAHLYSVHNAIKATDEKLSIVGLSHEKNKRIGAFSRGMKQRLCLARALINKPKILFLDEPTLGLDPKGQEDIQILLKALNADGVTIFYSSHLLNEVAMLCSRIAVIHHGKLVAQGTISQLQEQTGLTNSGLKDIFLKLTGD